MHFPLFFNISKRLLLVLVMFDMSGLRAQSTLPPVEVRATAEALSEPTASRHVTVIDAQDIMQSTATSLADLLSAEGNLPLLSYFGNGRNAAVDMRGMGVSAGSNVLIVVDGIRLNANDLSGPDLSALSLDQIEKIEIVRGGGSVREGSGAVGGVIRITTRRSLPADSKHVKLQLRAGSNDSKAWALRGAARTNKFAATVHLNQDDSRGYRDNGQLNTSGAALALQWSTTLGSTITDLHANISQNRDQYGLPGPVSLAAFNGSSKDRKSTQAPLDGGQTEVMRYEVGALLDWGSSGSLAWRSHLSERYNPYRIGVDASRSLADQDNQILADQWEHHVEYTLEGPFLGGRQSSVLGWDAMDAHYERWENGLYVPGSDRLLGQASSDAVFVESTMQWHDVFSLHMGLRWNKFSSQQQDQGYNRNCSFSPGPIPILLSCSPYGYETTKSDGPETWVNRTAELGSSWRFSSGFVGSYNVSRNFRAPNTDELLLAENSLRPQQGINHEASIKHVVSQRFSWAATLFELENSSEIFYGTDASGSNAVNRNRENKTRRRGVELDVNWQLTKRIQLNGQAGYLVPRLAGSTADIALVPRKTGSLQVSWQPLSAWTISLNGRYVGSRSDGNAEISFAFPKLAPYRIWDLGLRYAQKKVQVKGGVQNLFNEIYSTQAYSQTYYPMPERNVYLSLDWSL